MNRQPPCRAWAEKLALRYEDLSSAEREALEAHVKNCPACAAAQEDYHYLDARLRALPGPTLKPLPRLTPLLTTQSRSTQTLTRQDRPMPPIRDEPEERSPQVWKQALGVLVACILLSLLLPFAFHYLTSTAASKPGDLVVKYTGHTNGVNALTWSPDGKDLASSGQDHTVQVWGSHGGYLYTYKSGSQSVASLANTVAWSPDGRYLAAGYVDGSVQVWNAVSGTPIYTYRGHNAPVNALAWSPDSRLIASGGADNTVQIWNALTGHPVTTYNTANFLAVYAIAWSPNGKYLAAGGGDNLVRVWDAQTSALITTYTKHTDTITAIAWSPDSSEIASASRDGTVQVWNAHSARRLLVYQGHHGAVDAVSWSHNGGAIASGGRDNTVQIWDAHTGQTIFTYKGHSGEVLTLAWSPDDHYIASGGWDSTAQVWDAPQP